MSLRTGASGEKLAQPGCGRPSFESLAVERRMKRLRTARPYDCRGSLVSLHLRAGASLLEVAAWAGLSRAHVPPLRQRHRGAGR